MKILKATSLLKGHNKYTGITTRIRQCDPGFTYFKRM
jgi:hypothetical protein